MAKNLLSDLKPVTKKTTTKAAAPVAQARATRAPAAAPKITSSPASRLPKEIPFEPSEPKYSSRYGVWYIAGICLVILLFSLSFIFEHATVTITPKQIPLSFDVTDSFVAQKDSTDPDAISYTVMKLDGSESIKIPGTPAEGTSIASRGKVVVYNNFTSTAYPLIKNTRLQSADGRIYRIQSAVTIPGYTKSGTTTTPGSIEADVYADVGGEVGNLDKGDLTLPAFKDKPQFDKIYARTKIPIAGGLSGASYTVSADAASTAGASLKDKLKASLIAKAKVQVPDGYLFYDGATSFVADDTPQTPSSTTADVPVALSGTIYAYLIKQDTLVKAIAKKFVSQYNGESVTVPNISSLTLTPAGTLDPSNDNSFSFTMGGDGKLLWSVDDQGIRLALAGKSKSEFNNILSTVSGIDKADMVIKPFWKRSFPDSIARITVNVLNQ